MSNTSPASESTSAATNHGRAVLERGSSVTAAAASSAVTAGLVTYSNSSDPAACDHQLPAAKTPAATSNATVAAFIRPGTLWRSTCDSDRLVPMAFHHVAVATRDLAATHRF